MLKFDPSNVDLLSQKQRLLTEALSSSQEKLTLLKQAQQEYIDSGKNLDAKEYIYLEQQIQITENSIKNLTKQQNIFNADIQAMGVKLNEFGEKSVEVGKKMSVLSAGIVGIGAASMKAWGEVDDAMDAVAAGTGATGDALEKMQQIAKNVYTELPVEIADTGNAVADLNTRFGFTGDVLEESTEKFLKFAKVNGTDVSSAIEVVAKAMYDAGIDSSEYASVLDQLTAASQASGMTVDQLASSLSQNGVQMRQLGFDTESTIALLATMEKNGVNVSTVMTGMKKAMQTYADAGKDANVEFANLVEGIQNGTVSAADAMDVFGTRAGASLYNYIQEGKLNYTDLLNVVQGANGQLEQSWNDMLDPADMAKVAMNNLKEAGSELGTAIQTTLLPIIMGVTSAIQGFTQWFSNLDPAFKQVIVVVGLVVAAIGPLLIIIGKISMGISSIINLVGLVGGAIGGFSATTLLPFIGVIGGVVAAIVAIIAIIQNWGAITEWFGNVFQSVADWGTQTWNSITNSWNTGIQNISNFLTSLINDISNKFSQAWNTITSFFSNILNGIVSWGQNTINSISSTCSNIINSISNTFSNLPGMALEWGKDMIDGFVQGIQNTVGAVIDAIGGVANKIKRLLHFSRPDEGPLRDYETWMPDMMSGLAKGIRDNSYRVLDEYNRMAEQMKMDFNINGSMSKVLSQSNNTIINLRVVSELEGKAVSDVVTNRITQSMNSRNAFKGVF